jgi:hypothetical protein
MIAVAVLIAFDPRIVYLVSLDLYTPYSSTAVTLHEIARPRGIRFTSETASYDAN